VVVIRERDGKTLPGVFASEVAALNFIRTRIARGTTVYADEAGAWNELHGRFTMHRINHQEAYSLDGDIYTNNAESFFSRMRRAEIDGPPQRCSDLSAAWDANIVARRLDQGLSGYLGTPSNTRPTVPR
jgi:hypothetical protein